MPKDKQFDKLKDLKNKNYKRNKNEILKQK